MKTIHIKPDPQIHFMYSPEGDWEGMYINGKLVFEGHNINAREAVAQLVINSFPNASVSASIMSDEDLECGHCPKKLNA